MDQLDAHDCDQNVTEPQATEDCTKVRMCTTRNCESGLAKACCTQADPAHIAYHLEMALDR